jgi:uncharacterized protein YjbJ (UPF0337 family)
MNWDQIAGRWMEAKGKVRENWGRLTKDELDVINGRREQLEGTIERVYGRSREEAKKEVDDFARTCDLD